MHTKQVNITPPTLAGSIIKSRQMHWWETALVTIIITGVFMSAPAFVSRYSVIMLITSLMYVTLAVNWSLFCGTTQYFSLGIAAFFGVGIYVTAIASKSWPGVPLFFMVLCGGAASMLLALLVGLTTLRLKGMYFAIFTFGLSEFLRHAVMWWEVNITGTVGRWINPADNVVIYRYMVIIAVGSVLGIYLLHRSRYGLALKSIGDNELAAEHMGINTSLVKIITFGVTCFMTGAAGAVVGARWTYIDADVAFDSLRTIYTIMMSLFGGVDLLIGPIIGAFSISWVADVVLAEYPSISRLLLGLILVFVVIFLPNGLTDPSILKKMKGWFVAIRRKRIQDEE